MGGWGVILLRELGVNGEDCKYDLFPNVVVHCIDIYDEHRMLTEVSCKRLDKHRIRT